MTANAHVTFPPLSPRQFHTLVALAQQPPNGTISPCRTHLTQTLKSLVRRGLAKRLNDGCPFGRARYVVTGGGIRWLAEHTQIDEKGRLRQSP